MITIKIEGIGKVTKNMSGFSRRIPKMTRRGLWLSSLRLAKRLREAAPKGATGYMKSKRGTRAVKIDKDSYGIMMPYYTDYVERDIIRSRGIPPVGKVLRWQTKKGKYIVGKLKTKGHPFTARTIKQTIPEIREIIEQQVNKAYPKSR